MNKRYIGRRFGRWLVRRVSRSSGYVVAVCKCGTTKSVRIYHLVKGNTRSCGCLAREMRTRHGMNGTSEYNAWENMIQRCTNPKHPEYKNYGARGIRVCRKWVRFAGFLQDMGIKPSSAHSLDRKRVNGNYCPTNCRWATRSQQIANRRKLRAIQNFSNRELVIECRRRGIWRPQ